MKNMSVYEEIKTGLEQAIAHEKVENPEDEWLIVEVLASKTKDYCFICGREFKEDECREFSREFDAYICYDCFDKLMAKPTDELNEEDKIIKREFE